MCGVLGQYQSEDCPSEYSAPWSQAEEGARPCSPMSVLSSGQCYILRTAADIALLGHTLAVEPVVGTAALTGRGPLGKACSSMLPACCGRQYKRDSLFDNKAFDLRATHTFGRRPSGE